MLTTVMIMWLGLLIPFFGTTLGSAVVFFVKNKKNELLSRCFSGIASGVMVAASIWSSITQICSTELSIWSAKGQIKPDSPFSLEGDSLP